MEEFSQMIAAAMKLPVHRIENTLKLLTGGATIPFISRYRKEATGELNEVQIGEIQSRYEKLCELSKRKETILSTISEQGKLTDTLKSALINAGTVPNWKTSISRSSPNGKPAPKSPDRKGWNHWLFFF